MDFTIENNHLSEVIPNITDSQGLTYRLEIRYAFNHRQQPQSVIYTLIRDESNCRVGQAACVLYNDQDFLLVDIQIFDNIDQRRGLGSFLLKSIIDLGRKRNLKRLYASIAQQDINNNPWLINWLKRHGFQIEVPNTTNFDTAIYRACLYL